MSNLERQKADLALLRKTGREILIDLHYSVQEAVGNLPEKEKELREQVKGAFQQKYARWYTEGCAVLRQILQDRLDEFVAQYLPDPKRKTLTVMSYAIQDFTIGISPAKHPYTGEPPFDALTLVFQRFNSQLSILDAAEARFESSLFDIKQMVRADLFDSELETATELKEHGYFRAAGAVAGVVLEKHLLGVCGARQITLKKAKPTISTMNDALKESQAIDVPTWRFIQRLGDLRNLCDHGGDKEPDKEDIADFIAGVDKISKTVY